MKNVRRIVTLVAVGLLVAAIVKELRTPPDQRTGRGTVFGFVPYDFRSLTPRRVRETLWNPSNPSVLVPKAFGVGWDVNFGALAELIQRGARFIG